jgi:hypothetical protein
MSSILYYSKYCEHSSKLLLALSRVQFQEKVHYINIDKREKSPNGEINVILENGEKLLLPNIINKVPSLLLMNRGHRVLTGNEIMDYLIPPVQQKQQQNNEPECFSLDSMSSMSDNYSFWDCTPDELSAKGDGGMRNTHNYYTINQSDKIETPPEDYTPNKVGQSDYDIFQQQRDELVKSNMPPQAMGNRF